MDLSSLAKQTERSYFKGKGFLPVKCRSKLEVKTSTATFSYLLTGKMNKHLIIMMIIILVLIKTI